LNLESPEFIRGEYVKGSVNLGFHVFLDLREAYKFAPRSSFPIPVKIYLKDIISVGMFLDAESLVCTSMTISEEEYNKAI